MTVSDRMIIREVIEQDLPLILEKPEIQRLIVRISEKRFADRYDTESRFDQILDELRQEREESRKKSEEYDKKWEESRKQWEESRKQWDENNKKWDESRKKSEEYDKKWEESQRTLEEYDKKFYKLLAEIQAVDKRIDRKYDSAIGALGARWGIAAESSFRNALKDILESQSDFKVLNITEQDQDGMVFGRPDQIEFDIIVRNGLLIICEMKSSMSKSDMITFYRKAEFYEKHHQQKPDMMMVISPMVDDRAKTVAKELGIRVYSYPEDVKL
jgi:hypothetical protein